MVPTAARSADAFCLSLVFTPAGRSIGSTQSTSAAWSNASPGLVDAKRTGVGEFKRIRPSSPISTSAENSSALGRKQLSSVHAR